MRAGGAEGMNIPLSSFPLKDDKGPCPLAAHLLGREYKNLVSPPGAPVILY